VNHITVDLAVNLKARHAAQNRAPVVEVVLLRFLAAIGKQVAMHGVELHIHQACGVVSTLKEGAQAHEVQGFVHQHGAHGHAA